MRENVALNANQSSAASPPLNPHMARLVLATTSPLIIAAAPFGMVLSQEKAAEDFCTARQRGTGLSDRRQDVHGTDPLFSAR
jgi:hypothetical protein